MSKTAYVIAGPTGCGKSHLAMALARPLHAEIVCMDSMQIYRGMDIGTAKPTREEQKAVPHHMLDIVDPTDEYSVSMYKTDAEHVIEEILARGKTPLLVGGTGFYLRALRHPMAMGDTAKDPGIRSALEQEAQKAGGPEKLHEDLSKVDPVTARRLHVNDVRRVIRALEVYQVTGVPFSQQRQVEEAPRFDYQVICLTRERPKLYERIEKRVDQMLGDGLVDEVRALLASGVPMEAQAMQGIGYKEVIPYLQGQTTLQDMRNLIALNTRHYAKRQETWMRREEDVTWLDAGDPQVVAHAQAIFQ